MESLLSTQISLQIEQRNYPTNILDIASKIQLTAARKFFFFANFPDYQIIRPRCPDDAQPINVLKLILNFTSKVDLFHMGAPQWSVELVAQRFLIISVYSPGVLEMYFVNHMEFLT